MMSGLLFFLIGCLVLVIVLYVAKLVLDQLELPPPVRQIVMLILALVGLVILVWLLLGAFGGATSFRM